MRILKFRAWSKQYKRMLSEFRLGEYMASSDFKDNEIMQFTGLHDKNGKEQFESDIVLRSDYSKNDSRKIAIIYWEESVHGWMTKANTCQIGDKYFGPATQIIQMSDKVIGNIYENPELLK